jgi:hypothetical protein
MSIVLNLGKYLDIYAWAGISQSKFFNLSDALVHCINFWKLKLMQIWLFLDLLKFFCKGWFKIGRMLIL